MRLGDYDRGRDRMREDTGTITLRSSLRGEFASQCLCLCEGVGGPADAAAAGKR